MAGAARQEEGLDQGWRQDRGQRFSEPQWHQEIAASAAQYSHRTGLMVSPNLPSTGLARQSRRPGKRAKPPADLRWTKRGSDSTGPDACAESRHAPTQARRVSGQPNRMSSGSRQTRLHRWCPRPERQFGAVLLRRRALQVREDPRDHLWLAAGSGEGHWESSLFAG